MIVAGPVPEAANPLTNDALLERVHGQPAVVARLNVVEPPAAVGETLAGVRETLQPFAWFTVNVWPCEVMVSDRAGPVFALAV